LALRFKPVFQRPTLLIPPRFIECIGAQLDAPTNLLMGLPAIAPKLVLGFRLRLLIAWCDLRRATGLTA
jgi:hypothetical protein